MKINIKLILLIIILVVLVPNDIFAQNKSVTPTNSITQQQIDLLKTKIASKVAELKLVEKRGFLGIVTDASDTQITLTDVKGDIRNIDVDELTKFYSNKDSFGISDITKGQTLGVLGLYNKESKRTLAREINDTPKQQRIVLGVISNINNKAFEITILKSNGVKYIFKIEDLTKSSVFELGKITKSGFSKLKINQTVIAIGLLDIQSPSKLIASRLISLPEISASSKIKAEQLPTIAPSTGSGIKLYPITK